MSDLWYDVCLCQIELIHFYPALPDFTWSERLQWTRLVCFLPLISRPAIFKYVYSRTHYWTWSHAPCLFYPLWSNKVCRNNQDTFVMRWKRCCVSAEEKWRMYVTKWRNNLLYLVWSCRTVMLCRVEVDKGSVWTRQTGELMSSLCIS